MNCEIQWFLFLAVGELGCAGLALFAYEVSFQLEVDLVNIVQDGWLALLLLAHCDQVDCCEPPLLGQLVELELVVEEQQWARK